MLWLQKCGKMFVWNIAMFLSCKQNMSKIIYLFVSLLCTAQQHQEDKGANILLLTMGNLSFKQKLIHHQKGQIQDSK